MEVIINGISYVPRSLDSIGVAVTTHNRNELVADTVGAILATVPKGTPVVVVDDGSEDPVKLDGDVTVIRHDQPLGIPSAKNRCIEELMALGVGHLFLFDDDTKPIENDWWTGYLESREHHLQYSWPKFANGTEVPRMDIIYSDENITSYGWSMGCMLYVTREAVNRVGGIRWEFGKGMEEHAEWSQRIHNAGLTTFVHQDISTSKGLFHAGDEHQAVPRSFNWSERVQLLERNEQIRLQNKNSVERIDYTARRDEILTVMLTAFEDPQRGTKLKADPKLVDALRNSVTGHRLTVLTDCLDEGVPVESAVAVYRQRWISYYQYLRDNPVRFAWLVDATDVIMLNDPFPSMTTGQLYTGWEPKTIGIQWMTDNGPQISEWLEANSHRMLVNTGVVGGDRQTLIELCRRVNSMWAEYPQADAMHEMPFFNHVVYEHFSDRLVTGPQVTTVFKSNATSDPVSWWAHK
jgi:hypothetical protein